MQQTRCAWPARRSWPGSFCSAPAWSPARRRRRGCASSSAAAGRRRSRPRSRSARAAARPAADAVKEILRQGGLTYPEPQGAVEGVLYHWAPTLITAPREVQLLARRYMFNLAAIAATLLSFCSRGSCSATRRRGPGSASCTSSSASSSCSGRCCRSTRRRCRRRRSSGSSPPRSSARWRSAWSRAKLPSLGAFSLDTQTFVMLGTALVACALAMAAMLAQVDARRRRAPASSRSGSR